MPSHKFQTSRRNSIFTNHPPAILANILILTLSFLQPSIAETQTRTINFPSDGSWAIGQVCAAKPGNGVDETWKNLREIGPARGAVKVPTNLPVCLVVGFDGVENLDALRKLGPDDIQILWFKGTNLQSKHFKQFSNLRGLRVIDCSSTDVSSAALPEITKSFPQLEALDAARTLINDNNLQELSKLKKLSFLSLHHNKITDASAQSIGKCRSLKNLNLRGTEVGDRTASSIALLSNLEVLSLLTTDMTDAGFRKLFKMKHLKRLTVSKGRISEAAIAQFKQNLPQCIIEVKADHRGQ